MGQQIVSIGFQAFASFTFRHSPMIGQLLLYFGGWSHWLRFYNEASSAYPAGIQMSQAPKAWRDAGQSPYPDGALPMSLRSDLVATRAGTEKGARNYRGCHDVATFSLGTGLNHQFISHRPQKKHGPVIPLTANLWQG